MSPRRAYLDQSPGQQRGVVTLHGKPERLLIVHDGDFAVQFLGARVAAKVRSINRTQGLAFLDLGAGPDATMNLTPTIGPIVEGAWVDCEVRSEARAGKGAAARWLGTSGGPTRLLADGPSLEDRLRSWAGCASIEMGRSARTLADQAQAEALEIIFPLTGGGSISVESTRALTAVDVDLGGRSVGNPKQAARSANLAALAEAARVLRLKGLGGLVVIDLVGRGHDAQVLLAAARSAFAADNPGVALGPISRFGTLELTIPRRVRPVTEVLSDASGEPTVRTVAMTLVRRLEEEAECDRGGRFEALAAPEIANEATTALAQLVRRVGARCTIRSEPGRIGFDIVRL